MQVCWRAQFIAILLFEALLSFNCGQSSSPDSPTLPPPDVSVSISPTTSAVATGQSLQLSASVIGASQTAVTWSIISPASNAGTISSTGLYTAPATALATPVTIRATSVANTSKSATATVWVIAPGQVSPTINVLVAQYTMSLPDGAKMKVEFGPDTSYGLSTWQESPPSGGGTVNMLVAGMRASTTYHMRAVVDLPDGAVFQDVDHTFQTGTLPATRVPQITVTTSGTLQPNPGVEKLTLNNLATQFSSNNPLQAIVTDLQGNVIWYYDVDPTGTANLSPLPYRFLPNGHVLVNAVVVGIAGDGIGGDLREIDLVGNIIREMNADELNRRLAAAGYNLTISAIHHDFCLLPNGHVILLINHWKDFTDLVGYTGTVSVLGCLNRLGPELEPCLGLGYVRSPGCQPSSKGSAGLDAWQRDHLFSRRRQPALFEPPSIVGNQNRLRRRQGFRRRSLEIRISGRLHTGFGSARRLDVRATRYSVPEPKQHGHFHSGTLRQRLHAGPRR